MALINLPNRKISSHINRANTVWNFKKSRKDHGRLAEKLYKKLYPPSPSLPSNIKISAILEAAKFLYCQLLNGILSPDTLDQNFNSGELKLSLEILAFRVFLIKILEIGHCRRFLSELLRAVFDRSSADAASAFD